MSQLDPLRRAVLLGETCANEPPAELSSEQLSELVRWASDERLDGLLWNALSTGRLGAPSGCSARAEAADRHLHGLRVSLAAEAAAAVACSALQRAGVDALLFKGIAASHLDYPDPALRTFFDADILVDRSQLPMAIEALTSVGFRREVPPLRRGWEHRFARAVVFQAPNGAEVDLHAAIAAGYFGRILNYEVLTAERVSVDLGGLGCRALSATGRLVCSSYALALSRGPSLRLAADLVRQLVVSGADWHAANRIAAEGHSVMSVALARVADLLALEHEAITWAQAHVPNARAQRALDHAELGQREGWSADARSTLMALQASDRVRFMAGLIAPSRAYRVAQGKNAGSQLKSAVRWATSTVQRN